ncbi:MAG: 6,7-dimethyl-8-ribityllumazine synthase [Planctomycetota bacterium]|jgi:6,7-dimethyl-8-ribityllumazine synthase|nr:6,7-dimethyl-8-ribityllumazine synthase [Planctomycetota bacterium]
MAREIGGTLNGAGLKVAIAAARFNSRIVEGLVGGTLDGLVRNGVADGDITIARCPGSMELPLLCRRLATSGDYDAVIALGCVIRGETPHFDYVAGECAKGVSRCAEDADLPVIFGVLTTDTVDQAMNRAGIKHGNKGFDCALAAIEMCTLLRGL